MINTFSVIWMQLNKIKNVTIASLAIISKQKHTGCLMKNNRRDKMKIKRKEMART